jgi:C4-dicarboxylate transporter DctM subunit
MIALLFISFFVLMLLNIPIAVCIGIAAIITIVYGINVPLVITAQTMSTGSILFLLWLFLFLFWQETSWEKVVFPGSL